MEASYIRAVELKPVTAAPEMAPKQTRRLAAERPEDMLRAAAMLRDGGTVAFPTETVYGLGANALSAEAVEQIFAAKQRPRWDPIIVHVCDHAMLARVVRGVSIPDTARKLMKKFWPGPLTLLLARSSEVPDAVTAGRPLVGVRMPGNTIALELIRLAGVPIAAPSANRFGHTSPTTAEHVIGDLGGRIDAVLDGGACELGLESTVAEVTGDGIVVYRPGGLDFGELEALHDVGWVRMYQPPAEQSSVESLPSPGVSVRHYAPKAKLVLIGGTGESALSRSDKPLELSLAGAIDSLLSSGGKIGVMLPDHWHSAAADFSFAWGPWGDGVILARRLFAGLRELDEAGATVIVCPVPEMAGIGQAIRDRLRRAAAR